MKGALGNQTGHSSVVTIGSTPGMMMFRELTIPFLTQSGAVSVPVS